MEKLDKKIESLEKFSGKIKDIFRSDANYTFLIGAGISMEAPSNLPSAREIVTRLVELCAPEECHNEILSLESLRFEMVVEHLKSKSNIDKNLEFMEYFAEVTTPNLIHLFLAKMVINGEGKHKVITTNFDYLIEYAFKSLLPSLHKYS